MRGANKHHIFKIIIDAINNNKLIILNQLVKKMQSRIRRIKRKG